MSRERVRIVLIVLLAAAAALSVAGHESGWRALTAIAYVCFAAAVVLLLRFRRRGRVLDREEKTPE